MTDYTPTRTSGPLLFAQTALTLWPEFRWSRFPARPVGSPPATATLRTRGGGTCEGQAEIQDLVRMELLGRGRGAANVPPWLAEGLFAAVDHSDLSSLLVCAYSLEVRGGFIRAFFMIVVS